MKSNPTREVLKLKEIISKEIHISKSAAHSLLDDKAWKAIDSDTIAKSAVEKILEFIELNAFIPCCHTTGMHDPQHFDQKKYICGDQKAEAFERLCKALNINPVTRSKPDCGWCRNYPEYRKGEGLKLFGKNKEG